LTESDINF